MDLAQNLAEIETKTNSKELESEVQSPEKFSGQIAKDKKPSLLRRFIFCAFTFHADIALTYK